jgi:hypothetical protein
VTAGTNQSSSATIVPRVVTFFTSYPEPIAIPDGAYFCVAMEAPVRGFIKVALHITDNEQPVWLSAALVSSIAVSVRFHRSKRAKSFVTTAYEDLMPVVRKVAGASLPTLVRESTTDSKLIETQVAESDTEGSPITVVEMTTQLVRPGEETWEVSNPDNAVMGPTLTRCIEALILIIDGYRLGCKANIPAPARERLGPVIIAATRAADPAEGGWDPSVFDVLNTFAAYSGQALPQIDPTKTTHIIHSVLALEHMGHPLVPLMQLQADVNIAFYRDGNFRAAVIFAHTASEVLMDTAILAMHFEENAAPEDAVMVFDKQLKTRVLRDYHKRLGGSWDPSAEPVGKWLHDLLRVRHLVAHTGYAPTYDEARLARDGHYALGTFLRDRLAARVQKYPFTAGMLVTPAGFARRGIHTRAAKQAAKLAESQMLQDFLTWRANVLQLRGLADDSGLGTGSLSSSWRPESDEPR